MITVRIMSEFLRGPVWIYEDGIVTDDLPIVNSDTPFKTYATERQQCLLIITNSIHTMFRVGLITKKRKQKKRSCLILSRKLLLA